MHDQMKPTGGRNSVGNGEQEADFRKSHKEKHTHTQTSSNFCYIGQIPVWHIQTKTH